MSINGSCQTCGNVRSLETCVGCGRSVCAEHRGDEGGGYWNATGKKGYACGGGIQGATVYEGGALGSVNARAHGIETAIRNVDKYVTGRLIVEVQRALSKTIRDAFAGKTIDAFTRETIEVASAALGTQLLHVERTASNLVDHSIGEASKLVTHAIDELARAISAQRAALIEVDVEKLAATLEKRLGPVASEIRMRPLRRVGPPCTSGSRSPLRTSSGSGSGASSHTADSGVPLSTSPNLVSGTPPTGRQGRREDTTRRPKRRKAHRP